MEKAQAMETISDMLIEAVCDGEFFDGDAFNAAVTALGTETVELETNDLPLFAAAFAYYGGFDTISVDEFVDAVVKASTAVYLHNVTFFPEVGVDSYAELGMKLVERDLNGRSLKPYWLEDYIDWEQLGSDFERTSNGKFTRFGFFSPLAG